MKRSLAMLVLSLVPSPVLAAADPATTEISQPRPDANAEHPNPRFEVGFRRFNISNLDRAPVPLSGGQLDLYPLSRRWVRLGFEGEAGMGDASYAGVGARLWYALGGISLGIQYPARVTPFVAGRFAAGALGGTLSSGIPLSSGELPDTRAATFFYVGGIDAGLQLYTIGRLFIAASIGWAHPVYDAPDVQAMKQNPNGRLRLAPVGGDTFTFKLSIGI